MSKEIKWGKGLLAQVREAAEESNRLREEFKSSSPKEQLKVLEKYMDKLSKKEIYEPFIVYGQKDAEILHEALKKATKDWINEK